jgi:hypothetical protein
MSEPPRIPISEVLGALGEILASEGEHAAIVVVGGTALIAQGFVERATGDVDVIAVTRKTRRTGRRSIKAPEPLPQALVRAIARVARDFNLPGDWMNTTIGRQWETGLPPGFSDRIHWRQLGGLWLGLADRYDLIMMKLYAAADGSGPESVHFQDLLALKPTNDELRGAAEWVLSQDASPEFAAILGQVLEEAKRRG